MSTRCHIGIERENGTIEHITCTYDGWVGVVGSMLYAWYTREKLEELISIGNVYELKQEIADCRLDQPGYTAVITPKSEYGVDNNPDYYYYLSLDNVFMVGECNWKDYAPEFTQLENRIAWFKSAKNDQDWITELWNQIPGNTVEAMRTHIRDLDGENRAEIENRLFDLFLLV